MQLRDPLRKGWQWSEAMGRAASWMYKAKGRLCFQRCAAAQGQRSNHSLSCKMHDLSDKACLIGKATSTIHAKEPRGSDHVPCFQWIRMPQLAAFHPASSPIWRALFLLLEIMDCRSSHRWLLNASR